MIVSSLDQSGRLDWRLNGIRVAVVDREHIGLGLQGGDEHDVFA